MYEVNDDPIYDIDPLWRLHPFLTLREAAALIAGYCPTQVASRESDTEFSRHFSRYDAALSVLRGAVQCGDLPAEIARDGKYWHIRYVGDDEEGEWQPVGDDISHTGTRVRTKELRFWLAAQGFNEGFFASKAKQEGVPYLDETHPRYAPKLAAAVRAWMAVEDPKGKAPKQALVKWLREHGASFGLSDDEGKPNETGIEECAKVANWQPGGGAPKTPNGNSPTP